MEYRIKKIEDAMICGKKGYQINLVGAGDNYWIIPGSITNALGTLLGEVHPSACKEKRFSHLDPNVLKVRFEEPEAIGTQRLVSEIEKMYNHSRELENENEGLRKKLYSPKEE